MDPLGVVLGGRGDVVHVSFDGKAALTADPARHLVTVAPARNGGVSR